MSRLRPLSDAELLAKAADILCRLMPHFLKARPGHIPEVVNPSTEEVTHFIEDDGLSDMRRILKHW